MQYFLLYPRTFQAITLKLKNDDIFLVHLSYPKHSMDVYIMNHEVIPCSFKMCDGMLNSTWEHFGLHQEEIVRVTMKFEVSKRPTSKLILSIVMFQQILQWERQKRFSHCKCQWTMAKKC